MKYTFLLVSMLSINAFAANSTCQLTIRKTGADVFDEGTTNSFTFKSSSAYKFFQKEYGNFFFQLASQTNGPADGPVGEAIGLELMIPSKDKLAESTTSYLPTVKKADLSLTVPNSDGTTGTLASMNCYNL